MKDKFIELTTEGQSTLIGIANIAMISHDQSRGTKITLNFARGSDLYPKSVIVEESYEKVRGMLGL